MSDVISKDKMTAYQRWEMTSFNETHSHSNLAVPKQNEHEKQQNQLHQEAYSVGYKEGYKEGYEQAYEEGEKAGFAEMQSKLQKEVQESISSIEKLGQHFAVELANAHSEVGGDFISLAIDLAQAMTKAHFELHPEAITDIVSEAISLIPHIHQPAHILLNPLDAKIIEENLSQKLKPEGWKIIADQHIERGGCKIETAQNIVDASFSTRWSRLTEYLQAQKIQQPLSDQHPNTTEP